MNWLWVALGGGIGAVLRYACTLLFSQPQMSFPWATWSINLFGCLCAGIFFAYCQKYPILNQDMRLFLMIGILGGFTTFSSFGLETFQMLKNEQWLIALFYTSSSVLLGVTLLAVGYYLTQTWLGQA